MMVMVMVMIPKTGGNVPSSLVFGERGK